MDLKKYFTGSLVLFFGLGGISYYRGAFLNGASSEPGKFFDNLDSKNFRQKNLELFKKMDLVYLEKLQVNLKVPTMYFDVKHSERYKINPSYYDDLSQKYSLQIAQGYVAPMSIRFINDQIGYGTFAEGDIAVDQMVGEYTGVLMEFKDIKDTKYTWDYLSGYDADGKLLKLSVDAAQFGNEMRFVNHDYQPNAVMKYIPEGGLWHVVYIASRPIKKGEQILTNYGQRYWSGKRGAPHQFVNIDGSQVIN